MLRRCAVVLEPAQQAVLLCSCCIRLLHERKGLGVGLSRAVSGVAGFGCLFGLGCGSGLRLACQLVGPFDETTRVLDHSPTFDHDRVEQVHHVAQFTRIHVGRQLVEHGEQG